MSASRAKTCTGVPGGGPRPSGGPGPNGGPGGGNGGTILSCPADSCVANPQIQEISQLPSGTSGEAAANTNGCETERRVASTLTWPVLVTSRPASLASPEGAKPARHATRSASSSR